MIIFISYNHPIINGCITQPIQAIPASISTPVTQIFPFIRWFASANLKQTHDVNNLINAIIKCASGSMLHITSTETIPFKQEMGIVSNTFFNFIFSTRCNPAINRPLHHTNPAGLSSIAAYSLPKGSEKSHMY